MEAAKMLAAQTERMNAKLRTLKEEAENGHLPPDRVATLVIEEIEHRRDEDVGLFQLMKGLAVNIDALYEMIEAHERRVTEATHHEPQNVNRLILSSSKELWYVK